MNGNFIFAGFGGQGILFSGKFLAYYGLNAGMNVSWLPSYGPEMRGGTASCSVILSEGAVGSPIVSNPDTLIVMNLPSLEKYEDSVVPGGTIYLDSTLITRDVKRTDVKVVRVPATRLASDNGMPTLANMILMGKVMKDEPEGAIAAALKKVISAKHSDMLEINMKALSMGKEYED